jgi:hypothetical protein
MPRSKPYGHDRLGILGAPFGSGHALAGTHANFEVDTDDFMIEITPQIKTNVNYTWVIWSTGGANHWYAGVQASTNVIRLNIDGLTVSSSALPDGWLDSHAPIHIFADRDGNAYFYYNGVAYGSADISSKSAVDLDDTTIRAGGRESSGQDSTDTLSSCRLFVIDAADFPGATERAAIALERALDPDVESLTLAARTNYATERRLDLDFNDTGFTDTAIDNLGTGANMAIQGPRAWRLVRSQAEIANAITPDQDWYVLDNGYTATNAAADLGCVIGGYICEIVLENYRDSNARPWRIEDAGATDRFEGAVSGSDFDAIFESGGVTRTHSIQAAGYSSYGWGRTVIHQLYSASTNLYTITLNALNGVYITPITDLDLSGNLTIDLGEEVLIMRLWNFTASGGKLPTGWEAELKNRVYNPWTSSSLFDGTSNLKGEWILSAGAQVSSSTVIVNQANPGTGDLTISGGATFGAARRLVRRGI